MIEIIVSCICDTGIFLWFNNKLDKRNFYKIRSSFFFLILATFTNGMNNSEMNGIVLRLGINFSVYFLITLFLYKGISIRKNIIRTVSIQACIMVTELSISILLMIVAKNIDRVELLDNSMFWFISFVSAKVLEVICLSLIKQLDTAIKHKYLSWHLIAGVFLLSYLCFVIYCFDQKKIDYTMLGITFIVNIIFIFIIFGGYFIYLNISNRVKIQEKEIELLYDKSRVQMNCYKEMNSYKKQLQKIYHDMKNHMLIVESLEEKTKQKYLESLQEYFGDILPEVATGNEILDLLLQKKIELCKQKDIEININAKLEKAEFINYVDIGVIFGNIIDNAIESCERVSIERKVINLNVENYEEFIVIHIDNPVKRIIKEGKRLITLKGDKDKHGLGLMCLEDSLCKYDASFKYEIQKEKFILTIVIPIKQ